MADVVEREKIDKSVEEMENLIRESLNEAPCSEMEFRCGLTRAMEILEKNGVYERDFEDLWEKVSQKMKSNNQIFKKNIIIQHTCGNCKHEKIPENEYPCRLCMHGADYTSDLWRAKEDE